MTVSYETWFSVKFMHEFYNQDNDTITECLLTPASDTAQRFFTGTSWLQRFMGDTLYVLARLDEDGKPALPVPADTCFRYYITCTNALFFNYTNIDKRIGKGYILYLSNFADNAVDSILNLSKPLAAYSPYPASHVFLPGDLVTDDAGTVYECIARSVNHPPTDAGFWLKRTRNQYVSAADVIRLSPAGYQYHFDDDIKAVTATVTGFRASGNSLTEYEALSLSQSFPAGIKDVRFSLASLLPGRYKVALSAIKAADDSVLSVEEFIYYDPAVSFKKALGVVEIFNGISPANPYALQKEGSGELCKTNYTIRFANRTAWWHYISKTTAVTGIREINDKISFNQDAVNHQLFVSSAPLPFVKRFGYSAPAIEGPSPPQTGPFPSPSVLKSETGNDGLTQKVFTEVYLNY